MNSMGWLSQRAADTSQRGIMLVETAVAIFLFAIVGTVVLSGVSVGALTSRHLDQQASVENLARNQFEYVLSQPYQDPADPPASCTIDPGLTVPPGYSITCEVAEYETGNLDIATISVTVSHDGNDMTLETVRAR